MNPINDVVIVGGGPNGLLLAFELALCGVQPIVLERLSEPDTLPKANGLVGRVVQALDYRGLYERFGGSPTPPRPVPYFQFGGLTLNLASLPSHSIYGLPIPQRRLEAILDQRARELGVDIRRGCEVLALTQSPDREGVDVDVQALGGPYRLSAKYLVGADGGQSVVRKQCGIDFPGITDEGFVLQQGQVAIDPPVAVPGTGELDVAGVGRFQQFTFNRTATGVFSYGMFKPGVYRVAVIEWGASSVPDDAPVTIDELRETVRRVTGGDIPMREVLAGDDATMVRSSGASSSRQAERYRQGRVFLVGDAAHVHSGVGGPGLNLGMQDAINLGWKLAGDVRGWAPPGLLDTYESERYPVGKRVIMHSRAQTGLLSPGAYVTAIRECSRSCCTRRIMCSTSPT